MSTYVSRILQVRKDGKWQNVEWFAKEKAYADKQDGMYKFDEWCDNAITFRQVLGDSELCERGFPKDIELEPEVREQLKNRPNWNEKAEVSKVIPGYSYYCYNTTWFTLAELYSLYVSLRDRWFDKYEKAILDKDFVKKIDELHKKFVLKEPIEQKSVDEEEDNFDEIVYLKEEDYHDFISVLSEYIKAQHIVSEIYGWTDDSDVRMLIYYS